MSETTMAVDGGGAAVTRTELGWRFIHWGLGLFITGFVVGFCCAAAGIRRASHP